MPKWAVEAAQAELAAGKRRLALRWPDEARPEPVPFQWGEYDRLEGTPVAGSYWKADDRFGSYEVQIREATADDTRSTFGQKWRFNLPSTRANGWTDRVQRGPLYATERDAKLAGLWNACDQAAANLEKVWDQFVTDRGFL